MKKYLNPIFILVLVFSFSFYVYAQEDENVTTSEHREETTQDEDEKRESNEGRERGEDSEFKAKMAERWRLKEENQRRLMQNKAEVEARRMKAASENDEKVKENLLKRCEIIEERVAQRIENYANNVDKHVENYTKLHDRLQEIITKLSDKGYDVSKLESDLDQLDDMVQDYAGTYEGFIAKLTDAQELSCGESEGAYKQALMDAQAQLKLAIEARQKIREFYAHTIRKDIQDIRTQKVNADTEAEGKENE